MRRSLTLSGLAGLAVLLAGALIGGIRSVVNASDNPSAPTAKLAFTQSGRAELPRGYRSWVHRICGLGADNHFFVGRRTRAHAGVS